MIGGILYGRKRAELIRQLKLCGASIVENAESIVGTEKRLTDITVSIYIDRDGIPHINVDRNFCPEGL